MLNEKQFNEVEKIMNDKEFAKVLSSANKTFCSLSNILRNLQTKDGWADGGEALFQKLGLPLDRKVSVSKFNAIVANNYRYNEKKDVYEYFTTNKHVEREQIKTKDENGVVYEIKVAKKDAEGNDVYTLKECVVRTWTVRTFARLVLQSQK